MGKTRQVANLVSDNNIFVDINADKVGIGTTNASSRLTVAGDVSVSGALTATSYGGTIGNATYAGYATTAGIATYATTAGVSTSVISGIASVTRLQVVGVSTFTNGPILIGSGTSTGTASQRLQITGSAYVSGSVGIGTTNPSNTLTVVGTTDIQGAVETVSTGSTYDLGDGKVILECNAQNGTVFTHNLSNGTVGIVSLRNFPVTKNSVTTYTILFTQSSSTPTGGIGNTTAATGIGTNITLAPLGVSGFTTSARVATATTVTLSTTASDVDIVSLAIHYNGSGTGTPGNYRVFATGNTGFRFGTVGF